MKNFLLTFSAFLVAFSLNGQCGNLYIAGVIDGPLPGGNPKGVQLCATGNITDLSIFGVGSANNGGGSDGQEYTFPAENIAAGSCFWLTESTNTEFNDWFGFDPCYANISALAINGDDAIELFCSGSVVDVFGDINTDGTGECWEYLDGWAKAADAVQTTTFDCAEWTFSGINALDGESTNATATTPYPNASPQTCPSLLPLPITLASFEAKPLEDKSVNLTWQTVSEENNDYFSIEHSTDGINFREVAQQVGNGTTSTVQNYSFLHRNVDNGLHYYRLKQVDFDGKFEYSAIVTAKVTFANDDVILTPNPTSDMVLIQTKMPFERDADFQILNMQGQVVLTSVLQEGRTNLELNIADFPVGIYYLQLFVDNEVMMKKIIKQ